MTAEVSHGRGGAGNINPDDTPYVDGEVVREGVIGSHGDGVYSAGRGGTFFFFFPSREAQRLLLEKRHLINSVFFSRRRQHCRQGPSDDGAQGS